MLNLKGILRTVLSFDAYPLSPQAPLWAYMSCAVGLFLYQSLDAIDGKQARRTNSSTPLGELFDHGCDSVSTGVRTLRKDQILWSKVESRYKKNTLVQTEHTHSRHNIPSQVDLKGYTTRQIKPFHCVSHLEVVVLDSFIVSLLNVAFSSDSFPCDMHQVASLHHLPE